MNAIKTNSVNCNNNDSNNKTTLKLILWANKCSDEITVVVLCNLAQYCYGLSYLSMWRRILALLYLFTQDKPLQSTVTSPPPASRHVLQYSHRLQLKGWRHCYDAIHSSIEDHFRRGQRVFGGRKPGDLELYGTNSGLPRRAGHAGHGG